MTMPGWYPDPSGVPGRFRWWDGRTWSAQTTGDPRSAPPRHGTAVTSTQPPTGPGRRSGTRARWWLVGLVGLVIVVVLTGWLVVREVGRQFGTIADPGGQSTRELCPPPAEETPTLPPQGTDGRVHGGPLSYPRLGPPWSAPVPEGRVAFGREVVRQEILIETDPDWLAGVFVGRLSAGDGFFTPEEGSKIVVECITGTFYGEARVTGADIRNTATTVDGHDAWLVETQLSFDLPGVEAKGEWLMVVIVDIGDGTAGLFFASVPDNARDFIAPARQAYDGLTVTR